MRRRGGGARTAGLTKTNPGTKLVKRNSNEPIFDNALQAKHGHSPHGHDPNGHNPHRHNPHRHNPHRHNPHRHTPLPTRFPTPYPTRSPTTRNPTSNPTTCSPVTGAPTTCSPSTSAPTTCSPVTSAPTPIPILPPQSPAFSLPLVCRAHPLKKYEVPLSCPAL